MQGKLKNCSNGSTQRVTSLHTIHTSWLWSTLTMLQLPRSSI